MRYWETKDELLHGLNSGFYSNQTDLAAPRVPVHVIYTSKTDEQIGRWCEYAGVSNFHCDAALKVNDAVQKAEPGLARNGGVAVECPTDDCGEDFYVYVAPEWTVDAILDDVYGMYLAEDPAPGREEEAAGTTAFAGEN